MKQLKHVKHLERLGHAGGLESLVFGLWFLVFGSSSLLFDQWLTANS